LLSLPILRNNQTNRRALTKGEQRRLKMSHLWRCGLASHVIITQTQHTFGMAIYEAYDALLFALSYIQPCYSCNFRH
jgi:hypothetical protein